MCSRIRDTPWATEHTISSSTGPATIPEGAGPVDGQIFWGISCHELPIRNESIKVNSTTSSSILLTPS